MSAAALPSLRQRVSLVVAARTLSTVIDIALGIATVRLLAKTDLAIFSYLLIIYQVVRYLATMGFPESVFYFFERLGGSARRGFCGQTLALLAVTGTIGGLLIAGLQAVVPWLVSSDWPPADVDTLRGLLPWLGLMAALEIPTWPAMNVLLAAHHQKQAALYEVLSSALTFAAVVGPLWLGYPLESAVLGLVVYAAVRFLGTVIWVNSQLPGGGEPLPPGSFREQVRYAMPLGGSQLVNRINRFVDRFVVGACLTPRDLANYTVAAQDFPLVSGIPFAVGTALISRYTQLVREGRREELLSLWYRTVRRVSLIVVPSAGALIVAAPEALPLVFGAEYSVSVWPFQIFTLALLLRIASFSSLLQAFGDTRATLWAALFRLSANVVLTTPATLLWGIAGTAGSTVAANALNLVFVLFLVSRHLQCPVWRVAPFGHYLRVLAVAGGAAVLALLVHPESLAPIPRLAATLAVYLVAVGVLAVVAGLVDKDEGRRLAALLSRVLPSSVLTETSSVLTETSSVPTKSGSVPTATNSEPMT
jgi:O-antigen/teichoic acid export membrane protein